MISVKPLASSSAGNAVLLQSGDRRLLLDAGLRMPELRKALRWQVSSLDAALITHQHLDHARAVGPLLEAAVPCVMLPATAEALKVTGHPFVRCVTPGAPVELGVWQVLGFEVEHDVPCLGWFVGIGDDRVLYLTDTGGTPMRFLGLTHVLIEANHDTESMERAVLRGGLPLAAAQRTSSNHLSITNAVRILQRQDLTRCREIHLLHLSDGNSNARAFRDAVQAATGVPTFVAGHQGNL